MYTFPRPLDEDYLARRLRAAAPDKRAEHDDEENARNNADLVSSHRPISFLSVIDQTY